MKRFLFAMCLCIMACAPSQRIIETALAQTQTAAVTNTPSPTSTRTPLPTRTITSTSLPSNTPTATALPGTKTAVAAFLTQTRVATQVTFMASFKPIDIRELITYPNNHIDEKVMVKGKIFNINGNRELQIWVGGNLDAVYVVMRSTFSGIYEDDSITVYGTIAGESCGTNSFGSEICQPLIINAFYTK